VSGAFSTNAQRERPVHASMCGLREHSRSAD
jgi:hypothetical protein